MNGCRPAPPPRPVTGSPAAAQGYPLSELDKAREGELGALNRLVAARTAAAQWAAFRRDLLFNLGVVRAVGL